MKKFIKIFCLVIGSLSLIVGAYFTISIYLQAKNITDYDSTKQTNKKVIIKGSLDTKTNAFDDMFEVEANSAILIREVEMVQWLEDEKGIRLVFANYALPSFKDKNGIDYSNPMFYKEIENDEFTGEATINGLNVSNQVIQTIIDEIKKGNIETKELEELPDNINKQYNLVVRGGEYVSIGDQWELGNVKVTYSSPMLDDNSLTIVGTVKNNTISIENGGKVYFEDVNKAEIFNDLFSTSYNYILIIIAGLVLILIGIIINTNTKKYRNK